MPRPLSFFDHLRARLSKETDRKIQDQLLDLWLDADKLATEWDAERWGFNPETWMAKERAQMAYRAARTLRTKTD